MHKTWPSVIENLKKSQKSGQWLTQQPLERSAEMINIRPVFDNCFEEAMSLIEKGVQMRKKTLGESHPKVAVSTIIEWG